MRRRIKFSIQTFIGASPKLYYAALYLSRSRRFQLRVQQDTEIVIEGYPRSANTFAVAAFQFAQGRPVKMAHHLHVPAQIIQAVRWGIPALVLIRSPEDAILSLLVREPQITSHQALVSYIRFYTQIKPYRSGFVLAGFEEVVSDFGSVIESVNRKFGTTFKPFVSTQENIAKVMKIVEEMDKSDQGKVTVTETTVARPSEVRERLKQQRRKVLRQPVVSKLMEKAMEVYWEMLKG